MHIYFVCKEEVSHGILSTKYGGTFYPCKIPPWNSMEFHGIRWNIFHGIPWSIRTWISMEFHGVFSMELAFHGIRWSIRT